MIEKTLNRVKAAKLSIVRNMEFLFTCFIVEFPTVCRHDIYTAYRAGPITDIYANKVMPFSASSVCRLRSSDKMRDGSRDGDE